MIPIAVYNIPNNVPFLAECFSNFPVTAPVEVATIGNFMVGPC